MLVGLLGLGMAAGFVFLKAQEISQRETERTALLAAADRAVVNFAAINGYLPCPDTTGSGIQNCAVGVHQGWLPVATLGLDASAPARGVTRLRYIAYRGAGADLTTGVDRFNPARWDFYASPSAGTHFGAYDPAQISVVDLCRGLILASGDPANTTTAHIPGAGAAVVNVAYALADGGSDLDGDGNVFDLPVNTLAAPGLDLPTRPADANYDDRVVAHGFSDLSNLLNCATATRSLDAMGQAVEVNNEVRSQAESARLVAIVMSVVNGVKALIQTIKLIASGVALATAISTLVAAASALAGAIGTCFVLVGCALIPGYAAAVASAATAVVLATTTVALNAAAVAYHVTATVQTALVAQKASAAVDPSSVNLADLLVQVQQAAADAAVTAAASNIKANAAEAQAATALTTYNNAVTDVRNKWHSYNAGFSWRGVADPSPKPTGWVRPVDVDPGDAKLNAVINSYKTYADAKEAAIRADGQYNSDVKNYNYVVAQNVAAKADAEANPTDQTKQQFYALTLTPEAQSYLANLLAVRDQSAINRQTAINTRDTAKTAYDAAKAALLIAYPEYVNDGFFDAFGTWVYVFYGVNLIDTMTTAYDTYLSKNLIAKEERKVATIDAKNATDATNAITALQAAIAAQQANGTAGAIVVLQGGEAILKAADLRGGVK